MVSIYRRQISGAGPQVSVQFFRVICAFVWCDATATARLCRNPYRRLEIMGDLGLWGSREGEGESVLWPEALSECDGNGIGNSHRMGWTAERGTTVVREKNAAWYDVFVGC